MRRVGVGELKGRRGGKKGRARERGWGMRRVVRIIPSRDTWTRSMVMQEDHAS